MNSHDETQQGVAAAPADAPKTLTELGVNGSLAAEFEAVLRAMGKTQGDRILGFTFTTNDGVRHFLRTGSNPEPGREGGPSLEHAA
ncbi:MAG TPA: hypothetical protein VMG32_08735 [Anaeromyxobacteraceae bacterium]|nr:hypothetical protein [Anaeromyxobacteraceae bacterium]